MGQILGLITTESLRANAAETARRQVFYDYPSGKFPLMGLLSLMEDMEEITDYKCGWWEERYKTARTITSAVPGSGAGPFASSLGTAFGANVTKAADATLIMYVQDASDFRTRDIVRINQVNLAASGLADCTMRLTAVDTDNGILTGTMMDDNLAAALYTTANNGLYVSVVGSSTAQGDRSNSNGRVRTPLEITNYTQIERTTVGPITGTALKMRTRYDSTPQYRKMAKDGMLRHMELMEKSAFFGIRKVETTTDADGDATTLSHVGGLVWFLTQWELGNVANGGAFNYRPSESSYVGQDWTNSAYEGKRIINANGTITSDQWDELTRRVFSKCSDKGYEKLVICGDKTLAVINKYVKSQSLVMRELNPTEESYGMKMYRLESPHGDLLFKTHPLFKEDPMLQSTMMILDMGNIGYHALEDRDTELLKNRQSRDADKRKDEWLTEYSLEFRYPETHMIINGLTGIRG